MLRSLTTKIYIVLTFGLLSMYIYTLNIACCCYDSVEHPIFFGGDVKSIDRILCNFYGNWIRYIYATAAHAGSVWCDPFFHWFYSRILGIWKLHRSTYYAPDSIGLTEYTMVCINWIHENASTCIHMRHTYYTNTFQIPTLLNQNSCNEFNLNGHMYTSNIPRCCELQRKLCSCMC